MRVRATVAALVSSSVLAACTRATTAPDGKRPIEVVVSTEIGTLDPRFSTKSLDVKVSRLVHAGLVGLDESSLEPVPLAAESLEWTGARTLDVVLRNGVRFHSGRPLAPEDVCATLAAVKDPTLGSPHRTIVQAIATCAPTGERSVSITLGQPRATLVTDLEIPVLRADQAATPMDTSLDGLGPFSVASRDRAAVTLVPASTGLFPTPKHAIVVRTIRDENARAERLLAGRSDVAPNAISPALLPALSGREGLSVVSRSAANVTYLLFQNDREPFRRHDVRVAVARAIDRALIARTLLAGRATVATSFLPEGHWAAVSVPTESFDPEAARRTLAGLPEVTLLTGTDRARVTIARSVAQMLMDAGLPTRVLPLDLGVLLSRLDAGDFDAAILQIPELTEPNVLSWFFHPKGVPGEGGQGRNRARYRDPIAEQLFDAASATPDREVRRHLYAEIASKMAADLPALPLWHEDHVAVVSERARGFRPSAEGRWLSLSRME
jgi:peptide/nickel transport system substrate-binding protein